jgi:hypothetical protein
MADGVKTRIRHGMRHQRCYLRIDGGSGEIRQEYYAIVLQQESSSECYLYSMLRVEDTRAGTVAKQLARVVREQEQASVTVMVFCEGCETSAVLSRGSLAALNSCVAR